MTTDIDVCVLNKIVPAYPYLLCMRSLWQAKFLDADTVDLWVNQILNKHEKV